MISYLSTTYILIYTTEKSTWFHFIVHRSIHLSQKVEIPIPIVI